MAHGCLPAQLRPAPLLWAMVPPSFQPWGDQDPASIRFMTYFFSSSLTCSFAICHSRELHLTP